MSGLARVDIGERRCGLVDDVVRQIELAGRRVPSRTQRDSGIGSEIEHAGDQAEFREQSARTERVASFSIPPSTSAAASAPYWFP